MAVNVRNAVERALAIKLVNAIYCVLYSRK